MSYDWHDKCKENCGGYPQPYRPPGSRGPFGVPYRTLLSKNCLQTKNQTKKNSRLGISPNRLWFAARRVTRGDSQEDSLTFTWEHFRRPLRDPRAGQCAPSDQSELFPTSEDDWESLFVSDSSCFDSNFCDPSQQQTKALS